MGNVWGTVVLSLVLVLASAPPTSAADETPPVVSEVGVFRIVDEKRTLVPEGGLGDRLIVRVKDLKDVRALSQAVLHIDGRRLEGLVAIPDYSESWVQFDLAYTNKNSAAWNALFAQKGWTRPAVVTIGIEEGRTLRVAHPGSNFALVVIRRGFFLTGIALFLLLAVAFVVVAIKSDILRDTGPQPSPPTGGASNRKPYSLGRVQMAWWLFIVLASYLFIGTVTASWDSTISAAAMALIGISAATAVGAVSIDASKRSDADTRKKSLETERATLSAAPASATTGARLTQIAAELAQVDAMLAGSRSRGNFVMDILSDATGIALHRFQIAAWTLVLGVVFLYSVYYTFAMPQFSAELLALMGISGGAYLGFKYPERAA